MGMHVNVIAAGSEGTWFDQIKRFIMGAHVYVIMVGLEGTQLKKIQR